MNESTNISPSNARDLPPIQSPKNNPRQQSNQYPFSYLNNATPPPSPYMSNNFQQNSNNFERQPSGVGYWCSAPSYQQVQQQQQAPNYYQYYQQGNYLQQQQNYGPPGQSYRQDHKSPNQMINTNNNFAINNNFNNRNYNSNNNNNNYKSNFNRQNNHKNFHVIFLINQRKK